MGSASSSSPRPPQVATLSQPAGSASSASRSGVGRASGFSSTNISAWPSTHEALPSLVTAL